VISASSGEHAHRDLLAQNPGDANEYSRAIL